MRLSRLSSHPDQTGDAHIPVCLASGAATMPSREKAQTWNSGLSFARLALSSGACNVVMINWLSGDHVSCGIQTQSACVVNAANFLRGRREGTSGTAVRLRSTKPISFENAYARARPSGDREKF